MIIRVYHAYQGCETGCCGHVVEVDDQEHFQFEHPYSREDDLRQWAINLAKEVIAREYPSCLDSIDWDTIDTEDASAC